MDSLINSPPPTSDLPTSADDRPPASQEVQGDPFDSGSAPMPNTNHHYPRVNSTSTGAMPATQRVNPSHPRILVFSSEQTKLTSLSPFQRKDGCDRFGKIMRCDRLRDGSIEVEFQSEAEAAKALSSSTFTYSVRDRGVKRDVCVPISITPHRTKNFSKGIISCFDLRDTTDEEISEGLSGFGVTEARRIVARRGGASIPTNNIILTFDAAVLPTAITVGYTRVSVRPYVSNPMRCFRCQRFGHTKVRCRNRPVCAKCSSSEHLDEDCNSDKLRCVNCGDTQSPHASFSRSCPAFMKEKEINAIKATRNVSFREARDIYNQTHPAVSYARKAQAHVSGKTTLEQMSASQLVLLLKSFGLSVVAAGAAHTSATSVGAAVPVASPPASPRTLTVRSPLSASSQGPVSDPVAASDVVAATENIQDGGDGWTLVQRRRTARRRSASPPQPALSGEPSGTPAPRRSPAQESAVMAALRRGQEEKRVRDARRARLVERAREARRSPGDASSGSGAGMSGSSPPGAHRPMGPPPVPPPPQRPRVPPPPLPRSPSGERPPGTPQSAPRNLVPPSAPVRPGKRPIAWNGSPSEAATPRTRHKPQTSTGAGRSSSADGRLSPATGARPRIQFGDSAAES